MWLLKLISYGLWTQTFIAFEKNVNHNSILIVKKQQKLIKQTQRLTQGVIVSVLFTIFSALTWNSMWTIVMLFIPRLLISHWMTLFVKCECAIPEADWTDRRNAGHDSAHCLRVYGDDSSTGSSLKPKNQGQKWARPDLQPLSISLPDDCLRWGDSPTGHRAVTSVPLSKPICTSLVHSEYKFKSHRLILKFPYPRLRLKNNWFIWGLCEMWVEIVLKFFYLTLKPRALLQSHI